MTTQLAMFWDVPLTIPQLPLFSDDVFMIPQLAMFWDVPSMVPQLALFWGVSSMASLLAGLLLDLQIVLSLFSRIQQQLHDNNYYFHLILGTLHL